jgi:nucleoside-diphosphate-sugar epimerase
MRVAVTGATGFVGRHVVAALGARGAEVVAMSRHPAAGSGTVAALAVDVDTARPSSLADLGGADVLVHLAWSGLPDYRGAQHLGQWPRHAAFLDACLDAGVRRLLVAGTCLEYGMVSGELDEAMPAAPVTAYGQAKDALHRHLQERQAARPFDLGWLRLFYLFGPGQAAGSLYPRLRAAADAGRESFAMSPGDQVRDFVPVERAAGWIADLALADGPVGTVNLCSGVPVTVERMARDWLRAWNASVRLDLGSLPYPDYEPFAFWGSTRRLARRLEAR